MNKAEMTKSEDKTVQKKEWEQPKLATLDITDTALGDGSAADGFGPLTSG